MRKKLRIASLLPSSTEIVCLLGLEENLVGVTHECDFPTSVTGKPQLTKSRISHQSMTSREIDHAVRSQLDGHGSIYDLNTEMLANLKPDIILTQELCEVCAVSYQVVKQAAKLYVADAKVVSLEPNTISDIFQNILFVGEICGVKNIAEKAVSELKDRICRIKEKTNSIANRPKCFMMEWLEPPFAPGHWVPEQVEIAGGICLLGRKGEKSVTTTYEEIIEAKPEVLVLIPCGYYIEDIFKQLENTGFPEDFASIPAIKNGEVWAVDATSYFSRPGPRVVDGIEILAKIFHPEIFGRPDEREAKKVPKNLIRILRANSV
ncbi:MAG: cobalamin-binding protein [Pyrinomonadaceae bacterium]|nr:cobalamin-binding protein [Pyrinomonadaceae bacterium]MCX7640900.1 cobalamin-binding protein [Pyrinomonadaceae bacterium]MDW8303918.1 cobalamin-binding protein [Acidobacteriota bacterium]